MENCWEDEISQGDDERIGQSEMGGYQGEGRIKGKGIKFISKRRGKEERQKMRQ